MNLRPRMLSKIEEIEKIINEAQVCYLGMAEGDHPYVLPMNFAYDGGILYLHAAPEGHKLEVLKANPRVCINFNTGNEIFHRHKEVGCSWGMKFKSVNAFGKAVFIDDYAEKYRVMQLFMIKYSGESYEFSEPSIRNVAIIRIDAEKMTGKVYGY
jgi:nitroimidazol reductase NimA-like FMN-containing flavoprotein (pyridoxamine 5'-phosphate oxidase superfamily)